MSRYTKSRTKLSKRVGRNLFLKGARSFSSKDDYSKRPQKAGQHGTKFKFGRTSAYSKQLTEKQAIKFVYGLTEKQLGNLFKKSFRKTGDTGKTVLSWLEKRLDNVIYKAGLANSRAQARQLVSHGHFSINGHKVNIPSLIVEKDDIIQVKENKAKSAFWQNFKLEVPNDSTGWLVTDKKKITVVSDPLEEDMPKDFDIASVVEYYSRKVR